LPLKLFEAMDNDVEFVTGYEGRPNGEGIHPLLKNRVNGAIENNFYGVPYIAQGNKLMFL
jgi:TPP-dependent indolepyruvate ferredoxin oxidoreductase alpha subunit